MFGWDLSTLILHDLYVHFSYMYNPGFSKYMALYSLLTCTCTYLAFLGGDSGISGDQFCEDSTQSFNTERQWRHIQQQHILYVTRENTSLNSGTHGYSLIWINSLAGRSTKDFLYSRLHLLTTHGMLILWCKIIQMTVNFNLNNKVHVLHSRNALCTAYWVSLPPFNKSFLQ